MNEHYEITKNRRESYRCYNCGYNMEIMNPCHSCGEGEFKCPFCGELMSKQC